MSSIPHYFLRVVILAYFVTFKFNFTVGEDSDGLILPSPCETCKFVAQELMHKFGEVDKKKDVIDLGGNIHRTKKVAYKYSELGFIEAVESVCESILEYKMHKEHKDSKRFSKVQSETMRTLHNLKAKGVKVDLGIPEHLWDEPSAEVTRMKQECDQLVEEFEEDLEQWYSNKQLRQINLIQYLCAQRFLHDKDQNCLIDLIDTSNFKGDRGEL